MDKDILNFKIKSYIKIAIYNIIAVAILSIIFEFCIRLFVPEIKLSGTSATLISDSVYNFSPGLRQNAVGYSNGSFKSTNQYRFWKYKKPISKTSKKILIVGDSVTMGIGVEDDSTFPGIINEIKDDVDILNSSIIGYSSFDYFNVVNHFLSNENEKIEIDEVQVYWTLNDVYSNFPDKNGPSFTTDDFIFDLIYFLRRNSKAYFFIKSLFSDRSKAYFEYDKKSYSEANVILKPSIEHLKSISLMCRIKKIPLSIFVLPYEYQIRNFKNMDGYKPQKVLTSLLREYDIKVIDCSEAFKDDFVHSKKYYLWGDGIHFSEEGHKLIAHFILNNM